jgi:hypothetical protein
VQSVKPDTSTQYDTKTIKIHKHGIINIQNEALRKQQYKGSTGTKP